MKLWVRFDEGEPSKSGKTRRWQVRTTYGHSDESLGQIAWYTPWRCYAFWPYKTTLYEGKCLHQIALFCEQQTTELKLKHAREKKS